MYSIVMNRIVGRIETLSRDALEFDVHRKGPDAFRYVDAEGNPTEYCREFAVGVVFAQSDFFELCDLITKIGVACGRRRSTVLYPEEGMDPAELRSKFRNRAVFAFCDPKAVGDISARWQIVYTKLCHLATMSLEAASQHGASQMMGAAYDKLIRDEKVTWPEDFDAVYGFDKERATRRDMLRGLPDYDIYPDGCSPSDSLN